MRDLLDRQADDPRAADAVALFCYQARKWVGAFAAASAAWRLSCSRGDRRERTGSALSDL